MQFEPGSDGYFSRMVSIRSFPGMSRVSSSALAFMAERSHERSFKPGERIYCEGEPVKYLYFLLSGEVLIRRGGVLQAKLGARRVCDAISVFAREPFGPEAIAATEVTALGIDATDNAEIMQDNFDLMTVGLTNIAGIGAALLEQLRPSAPPRSVITARPSSFSFRLECLSQAFPFAASRLDALAELLPTCASIAEPVSTISAGQIVIPYATREAAGLRQAVAELPAPPLAAAVTEGMTIWLHDFMDWLEDYSEIGMRFLEQLSRDVIHFQKALVQK